MEAKRFILAAALFAAASASAQTYEFGFIGDTHFGGEQFYEPGQGIKGRYGRWLKEERPHLERAGRILSAEPRAAFAVHSGDLVDGRCGSLERQIAQLEEGWTRTRGAFDPSAPFIPINGNHETYDFEAPGTYAYPAYERTLQRRAAEECALDKDIRVVAGRRADGALERHFAFRYGPDLFIGYNSNVDEYDFFKKVFDENPEARYVFAVGHIPPINPTTGGIEIDSPEKGNTMEKRNRFLRLLQSRDTIVLCGDTHQLGLVDYVTGEGRLTELMSVSVCDAPAYREHASHPVDFPGWWGSGAHLPGLGVSPRQRFLGGGIVRFWYAQGAGVWKLRVSDEGVTADFYAWGVDGVAKSVVLRGKDAACEAVTLEVPCPIVAGRNRFPLRVDAAARARLARMRWIVGLPDDWKADAPHFGEDGCWLDVDVAPLRRTWREETSIRLAAVDGKGRVRANEHCTFFLQDEFRLPCTAEGVYVGGDPFAGGFALPFAHVRREAPDYADADALWNKGNVLEFFFDVGRTRAIARDGRHVQLALVSAGPDTWRALVIRDGGKTRRWATLKGDGRSIFVPWSLIAPTDDPGFVPAPGSRIGIDAAFCGGTILGGMLPIHKVYADPSVWGTALLVPKKDAP